MKQKNSHDITYDFSSLEELRGIVKACPGWDGEYILVRRQSLLDVIEELGKKK